MPALHEEGVANYLVLVQVHKTMLGEESPGFRASETTFKSYIKNSIKVDDKCILHQLKRLGAVGAAAPCAIMVPVSAVRRALVAMGMGSEVADCFRPLVHQLPPIVQSMSNGVGDAHPFCAPSSQAQPSKPSPSAFVGSRGPPSASAPASTQPPFPKTIVVPTLTDQQKREPYSLGAMVGDDLPSTVASELASFLLWSKTPIQLDRDSRYKACQEVTLEGSRDTILAYMGYLHKFKLFPTSQLSLTLYKSADLFGSFVGYIVARGVGRGWVARHITTCKKVCSFLNSNSPWAFHKEMEAWLTRLDQQVPTLIPKSQAMDLPSPEDVFAWVDQLKNKCFENVDEDMTQ